MGATHTCFLNADVTLILQLDAARRALDSKDVDYEATLAFKKEFARKVFDLYGHETLDSSNFKVIRRIFCTSNSCLHALLAEYALGNPLQV